MIDISNYEVVGIDHAIRGMRNPMNSWDRIDSEYRCPYNHPIQPCIGCKENFCIGDNDMSLMKKLYKSGTDHRKFMRMMTVYADILAPMYWWKEFDTYKVGTVRNSCSTMHKITAKKFDISDFSNEWLPANLNEYTPMIWIPVDPSIQYSAKGVFLMTIEILNKLRERYLYLEAELTKDMDREAMLYLQKEKKDIWYQIIQLLPSSYNTKATVMLNYEVLANMYFARRNHKLDEWHTFCDWCEELPYFDRICGIN